jgi:adenine deaminase
MAYLRRAHAQGVRHAEVFFDPQTHTDRGVPMRTIVDGIHRALEAGRAQLGITSHLILCFLRHLSEESALATLEEALPFRDRIVAVGLDSGERGNPPAKFVRAFDRARAEGFHAVAHAGEEGPAGYIWEALDLLHVERVDHGVRALDDDLLVERLVRERVPLTVCPLSNVRLRVNESLAVHPLRELAARGLLVTVNSDDPAYFGGYVNDNLVAAVDALGLDADAAYALARNGLEAAFVDPAERRRLVACLDAFAAGFR